MMIRNTTTKLDLQEKPTYEVDIHDELNNYLLARGMKVPITSYMFKGDLILEIDDSKLTDFEKRDLKERLVLLGG